MFAKRKLSTIAPTQRSYCCRVFQMPPLGEWSTLAEGMILGAGPSVHAPGNFLKRHRYGTPIATVVALAADPKVKEKSGLVFSSWAPAREYGFTGLDGTRLHRGHARN